MNLNEKEKIKRFTEPILNVLTHTLEVRFKVWKIRDAHLVNETEESHLMIFLFPEEIKYFLEVAGFHEIKFCPFLKLVNLFKESDWNMTVITIAK